MRDRRNNDASRFLNFPYGGRAGRLALILSYCVILHHTSSFGVEIFILNCGEWHVLCLGWVDRSRGVGLQGWSDGGEE